MTSATFGYSHLVKEEVQIFTISNKNGVKSNILSFGAAIQSLYLPWSGKSSKNNFVNVVLGYDSIEDYETNDCYIGVAVGRVAGRVSNGCFSLDNKNYHLTINNGGNCLHGGNVGISRKNWTLVDLSSDRVTLKCTSSHNEEGFPGDLEVTITYCLANDNSLVIEYLATISGHSCPVNLTNHSYFNLSGLECTDRGIQDHIVQIQASNTLELSDLLLPTGRIVPLHSDMDLRQNRKSMSVMLPLVGGSPKGFDNYYIFDQVGIDRCQATVTDGVTKMSLYTDQNGVQLYTSNFFDRVKCADNNVHHQHGALCLEAQNYPDAINHDSFPSIVVRPGQVYEQKTIYKFEKDQ